jgi:hypothetical protein
MISYIDHESMAHGQSSHPKPSIYYADFSDRSWPVCMSDGSIAGLFPINRPKRLSFIARMVSTYMRRVNRYFRQRILSKPYGGWTSAPWRWWPNQTVHDLLRGRTKGLKRTSQALIVLLDLQLSSLPTRWRSVIASTVRRVPVHLEWTRGSNQLSTFLIGWWMGWKCMVQLIPVQNIHMSAWLTDSSWCLCRLHN